MLPPLAWLAHNAHMVYLQHLVKQGTSGLAGRLAALNASLCLGFRRNSGEFRYSTELRRHNKRAGERPARHHITPSRRDMHGRFCPFPSCCLPASFLLCGRLPHRAPLVLPARPRADKTTLLLSRHQPPTHTHTAWWGGSPCHPVARPNRDLCFLAGDNEHRPVRTTRVAHRDQRTLWST